MVLHKEQMYVL